MIFHTTTYQDIQKYYTNNIIKLKESGDRLWYVKAIYPEEVKLVDVDGMELYIDLSHPYEVEFPLPGRAVYQCGPSAYMVARAPAKQYNRGIHKQNTRMYVLSSTGNWAEIPITLERLQQFVDKPCYQDINNLTPGYSSWALSPVFSVTPTGQVYALMKKIGDLSWEEKKVVVFNAFKPEIKALFTDWKVNEG